MLNRAFGRIPEPHLDPTLGNPEARRLVALLEKGDWQAADQVVAAARDWDLRGLLVSAATGNAGLPGWLYDWTGERPESPAGWLMLGARTVQWAWEGRGGRPADQTEAEAFVVFRERLHAADHPLLQAARLDPADPTPHVWRQTMALGLDLPVDLRRQFFEATLSRAPRLRAAHDQYLQSISGKWGGSDDLMLAFARDAASRADDGSNLHTLVALAHLERWVALGMSQGADQDAYIEDPAVQAEVQHAANRYLRSAAMRIYPGTPTDRAIFALVFVLMGDKRSAQEQFRALGGLVQQWPWGYLGGDAVASYKRAMKHVGLG